jgi:hypothetical protein
MVGARMRAVDTFGLRPLACDRSTMRACRRRWTSIQALSALGLVLVATPALAGETPQIAKPPVMMESGEVTNVIDAFDDDDPFDLNISLGFQYATKSARILRETAIYQPGLTTGGYTSNMMNVASYSEHTSRLIPQIDIGIYKDLAFYTRLPIVLVNTRKLEDLDGSAGRVATFESPDRSGVEYVGLGLNVDIFNQARDDTKPSWLLGLEVRIAAGEPMHACTANPAPGQVECADPSDVNRNGRTDSNPGGTQLEGNDVGELSPGITRGQVGLEVHTMMSKRVKYIEPYGGVSALFEFPQGSSGFDFTDLDGTMVNHAPLTGTITLGIMFIPWENREKFGRLTFDLRFTGDYISEGRDYSELFDALGSSAAASLRKPEWARYTTNPACTGTESCTPRSVVDLSSQKTYVTGLTDVEAHGSYRGSGSVTWQASEYFKLNAGIGLRFDQAHGITADQPCNPDKKDSIGAAGPCHSGNESTGQITATGVPDPAYRPSINAVGRRFFVDESWTFDVFANGVVMF